MNYRAHTRRLPGAAVVAFALLSLASQARAHFLFIRIGPQAEAGRSAEVFFSEQADAGDPKFVAKIAHTKLWIQTKPGEFHELHVRQAADRLVAPLPADRSVAVVGECEYGVLARPKQTPFLLRYYPKAVAGSPDELNRLTPRREIAFEIQATFESGDDDRKIPGGARVRLVALRNGKPIPSAIFIAVDSDLSEQTIKAGADGIAVWTPPAAGRYSVYTRETLMQPGTWVIRNTTRFASSPRWHSNGHWNDIKKIPKRPLCSRTRSLTAPSGTTSPASPPRSAGQLDGRPFSGKVTVRKDGSIDLQTDDSAAKPWLLEQLDSLVMHRLRPGRGGRGRGPPAAPAIRRPR